MRQHATNSSGKLIELKRDSGLISPLFYDLLHYATPHGLEEHIVNLFPFKKLGTVDALGNFIITIGDKKPTTMFSSHMDTVHRASEEAIKAKTRLVIRLLTKAKDAPLHEQGYVWGGLCNEKTGEWDSIQLGGDDKVGVYIMCKMIENKIPGLYVFHVGEERGCIGSKFIVDKNPGLVEGIKRCIAFDRMGYTDVISNQRGRACASSEFTNALATNLNDLIKTPELKYKGDVVGVYTDSANYDKLIPECTNISVGYMGHHTEDEHVDFYWLNKHLIPAIMKVDWNALPTKRDPKAVESYRYTSNSGSYYDSAWENYNYSGPDQPIKNALINDKTPYYQVPKWQPKDGYLAEASLEGMSRVAYKWVMEASHTVIANEVAKLVLERDLMKRAIAKIGKDKANVIEAEFTSIGDVRAGEKTTGAIIAEKPSTSQLAFVKDAGYPDDTNAFKSRAVEKAALLNTIFSEVIGNKLPFSSDKGRMRFHRLGGKFKHVYTNVANNDSKSFHVSKRVYRLWNEMLCETVVCCQKEATTWQSVNNVKLSRAYIGAVQHIRRYRYEPGISHKVAEALV